MRPITGKDLTTIAGARSPRADAIAQEFNSSAAKFGLDQPLRAAHFFAQVGHESGGFRYVREIWGPTPAQVRYEGRADLGNTQPGDGKRFMGRTLLQITGRGNTRAFTAWAKKHYPDAPDFEANPALLEQPRWALVGAFWFWSTHDLNALADRDDVLGVTRRVNGGTNGLADRKALLARAKQVFSASDAPAAAPKRNAAPAPAAAEPAPAPLASASVAPVPAPDGAPTPVVQAPKLTALGYLWSRVRGKPVLPPATLPPAAATQENPILVAQNRLKALGYTEVGTVDGLFGRRTRAAVLAFQADNHMPLTGGVDDGLLAALARAPARIIEPERAFATRQTLKQEVPEVAHSIDGLGMIGKVLLGASGLGAVDATGALDTIRSAADQATQTMQSVKSIADSTIGGVQWVIAHWWILGIILGLYVIAKVGMAALRLVVLLRQGRLL